MGRWDPTIFRSNGESMCFHRFRCSSTGAGRQVQGWGSLVLKIHENPQVKMAKWIFPEWIYEVCECCWLTVTWKAVTACHSGLLSTFEFHWWYWCDIHVAIYNIHAVWTILMTPPRCWNH
jgi:hypothetical protein